MVLGYGPLIGEPLTYRAKELSVCCKQLVLGLSRLEQVRVKALAFRLVQV